MGLMPQHDNIDRLIAEALQDDAMSAASLHVDHNTDEPYDPDTYYERAVTNGGELARKLREVMHGGPDA